MSEPHDVEVSGDVRRLLDENEQLRTALESSVEESAALVEDRDRLLRRVTVLARELQAANAAFSQAPASLQPDPGIEAEARHSQTEEELRVAFEELQVLTEELEVANTSLHLTNTELEARVAARTREIVASNAALRTTEAAFRTLVEGIPQLVWRADGSGKFTWSSPQWAQYTGQSLEESRGNGWLAAIHPDDREQARDAWARATERNPLEFAARICHVREQRYRRFRTRAAPVTTDDHSIIAWLGTSTDVDDLLQLQEQQSVLVGELQHRTRNLMAVVQAVMLRTLRTSSSLSEFRARIDDRLQALGRVQGLLSRRDAGNRVNFDVLLREELAAHVELDAQGNGVQVTTGGPAGVPLQSSIVQTFALAIHELTTNALKYGALATPSGHLDVRWQLSAGDGSKPQLIVHWVESGVAKMPGASATARGGGYGRELIERALPYQLGARTTYAFAQDGVHCSIEVDVPQETNGRINANGKE